MLRSGPSVPAPSGSQNGKAALAPRQCSLHGCAARPGWTLQIGGFRSSMGQTLTPSLRKARSAVVDVSVVPERFTPTRN